MKKIYTCFAAVFLSPLKKQKFPKPAPAAVLPDLSFWKSPGLAASINAGSM